MGIENFLDYTEVDPNEHITVTSSRCEAAGLDRDETAYVCDDKGAGHFTDFEHLLKIHTLADDAIARCVDLWALTLVENIPWLLDDYLVLREWGQQTLRLERKVGGGAEVYDDAILAHDTDYWLTVSRIDDTTTCKIYSDSDRTVEVDTIVVTDCDTAFRWVYGMASYNTEDSGVPSTGCYTENLDLQEVPPPGLPGPAKTTLTLTL